MSDDPARLTELAQDARIAVGQLSFFAAGEVGAAPAIRRLAIVRRQRWLTVNYRCCRSIMANVLDEPCGECQSFEKCQRLFQCPADSLTCDFEPPRFVRKGRITYHFACDVLRTGGCAIERHPSVPCEQRARSTGHARNIRHRRHLTTNSNLRRPKCNVAVAA